MNESIILNATYISIGLVMLGICLTSLRIIIGPQLSDRIAAFDVLYLLIAQLILHLTILFHSLFYLAIVLAICLLSFISTTALAKFMMYKEVIES